MFWRRRSTTVAALSSFAEAGRRLPSTAGHLAREHQLHDILPFVNNATIRRKDYRYKKKFKGIIVQGEILVKPKRQKTSSIPLNVPYLNHSRRIIGTIQLQSFHLKTRRAPKYKLLQATISLPSPKNPSSPGQARNSHQSPHLFGGERVPPVLLGFNGLFPALVRHCEGVRYRHGDLLRLQTRTAIRLAVHR